MKRYKSQTLATNKYNAKAYDSIIVRVKKGIRDEYKQAAKLRGLSLARLVTSAVDEFLKNHPPKND